LKNIIRGLPLDLIIRILAVLLQPAVNFVTVEVQLFTGKAAQSDPPWPVIFDHPLADLN
jgi:hypothetical protein